MTVRAAALAVFALIDVALVIGATACHRPAPDAPPSSDELTIPAAVDAPDAATIAAARCRRTEKVISLGGLGGAGDARDLEIGEAIGYPGGVAVGLIHHAAGGRTAAVALLHGDARGGARVVDLAQTLGDAPPPRLGWRGGDLVAAAYPLPAADAGAGDATRGAAVYTIVGDAVAGVPLAVPQRRDESFALDLAFAGPAGLLVWDQVTEQPTGQTTSQPTSAPRGVVKVAAFVKDHAEAARDVSPAESDAELPRVVTSGAGFLVLWIARRPEAAIGPDAAPAEATGEARAYGWLEMVAVDAHGAVTGPVRRLTSSMGHVSAYDVVILPGEPASAASPIAVLARDDGEATDGSGGALLRLRVRGDAVDPVEPVVTDGLGRGAPALVFSAAFSAARAPREGAGERRPVPAWVSWSSKDEQARLLPLTPSGEIAGRPSAEDALGDGQPLLLLAADAGDAGTAESEVLVAAPSDPAGPLRVFACANGTTN
jgi:hypothetical protein